MHDSPEPDDLEDLLRPAQSAPGSAALRQSVLQQTTRALHRRRRLRQLALVVALAACYVAGVLTVRLLKTSPVADRPPVVQRPVAPADKTPPTPVPPPTPAPQPPNAQPEASAVALEWKAFDSQHQRYALYLAAGDRYLEEGDLPSAVRCYRGALDAATEKDLNISANDNWLLMALKEAKQKEKRHASARS